MGDQEKARSVEVVSAFLLRETDLPTPAFQSLVVRVLHEMKVRHYAAGKPDEHWIAETDAGCALIFADRLRKPMIQWECPPMAVLALAVRLSVLPHFCNESILLPLRLRDFRVCKGTIEMLPDRRADFAWALQFFHDQDGNVLELTGEEMDRLLAETRFGPHDQQNFCTLTVANKEILTVHYSHDAKVRHVISPRDPYARHKLAFFHHLSLLWLGRSIRLRYDRDPICLLNGNNCGAPLFEDDELDELN